MTTEACNKYYEDHEVISEEVKKQIFEKLEELENLTGKKMGSLENPLLVKVVSDAKYFMPGMMDVILNLGMNDEVVKYLAEVTDNKRFAYDSYRRFIQMFADVVKGYDQSKFEKLLEQMEEDTKDDIYLTTDDMVNITNKFKTVYKEISGEDFPQDPKVQLIEAVTASFKSWNNERAKYYRKMNNIPSFGGIAVNIQEMTYGNNREKLETGIVFTKNSTNEKDKLYIKKIERK